MLFVFSFALFSQEVYSFRDNFKLNGFTGKAHYEYILQKSDTIKQGEFRFSHTYTDSTSDKQIHGIEILGKYDKNQASGSWLYSKKSVEVGESPQISGYNVQYPLSGDENLIQGKFSKGKAENNWESLVLKIQDSKASDTLSIVKGAYRNGVPVNAFIVENAKMKIIGNYNNEGFFDGKWEYSNSKISEFRIYQDGVFQNHFFTIGKDTVYVKHYFFNQKISGSEFETIDLNQDILELISVSKNFKFTTSKIEIKPDSISKLINQSNEGLTQAIQAFLSDNGSEIWSKLAIDSAFALPKLMVQKNVFSEEEQKQIAAIKEISPKLKKSIDDFFNDAQVDIYRLAVKDVAFYYEVMKYFRKNFSQLEPLFNLSIKPSFVYSNRQLLIEDLAPSISYPKDISIVFNDSTFNRNYSFPNDLNKSNISLEKLQNQLESMYSNVQKIKGIVEPMLEKFKKQESLTSREIELVERRDLIEYLFETKKDTNTYTIYHRKLSPTIISYSQELFKEYASLGIDRKVYEVDYYISCFDKILEANMSLFKLQKKVENLEELYTRTLWNPYTFTYMDEIVKDRVYMVYKNEILPFLITKFETELNCQNIEQLNQNFSTLYNRMVVLRETDTKEIEKSLRRTFKLEEKLKILSLSFGNDVESINEDE